MNSGSFAAAAIVSQRVIGGAGSKDETLLIAACYNDTYGNLREDLESEIGGSLMRAMHHAIADTSPAYFPHSLEITEDDDKEAIIAAWPQLLPEAIP